MKKIFLILKNDCKKIFRSIIAFIVVIGLSILPALYAWFNIASNWNPYDNSGNIDVAVVNMDKGCELGSIKMTFGDQIVKNLKQNTQMGWRFVDKETADNGVINGDYYAAVIISEDFSTNLISVTTGDIKRPEITYMVNEKKNAIAPKITDKGIEAIKSEVNASFVSEITNVAAILLNTSSEEIGENKDQICDKIVSALDTGKTELDTLKSSINVLTGSMDSLDSLIQTNRESLPTVKEKLNNSDELIKSIKNAGAATKNAATNLSDALEGVISSAAAMNSSFEKQLDNILNDIENITSTAPEKLSELTEINNKIIGLNNQIINILNTLNGNNSEGALSIINSIDKSISSIEELNDSYQKQLDAVFKDLENDTLKASEKISSLTSINQKIIDTNNKIISNLNTLNEKFGIDTSKSISYLNNINTKQQNTISKLNNAAKTIKETGKIPGELKNEVNKLLTETKSSISQFKKEYLEIKSALGLDKDTSEIISYLNNANKKQENIISKLNDAANTIKETGKLPNEFEKEIKALVEESTNSISKFKNEYLNSAKASIENVLNKSGNALDDISGILTSAASSTSDIDNALASAQKTILQVKSAFENSKTLIDKGIKNLDEIIKKINNFKNNSQIEELISKIFNNPEEIANFMSSPVKINTEKVYPVENYGSAMAPFYTVLSFWVGGIVLVAVMRTELTKKDIKKIGKLKPYQEYFGRYLIFMIISLLQSTITVLGDVFFLGVQCDNLLLFLLTGWITSIVFSLIIYSFTIAFSVIGKAIAVIILIVQVAGSGGTFPPELLPDFFQTIIPYLPFTHATNAIRETVTGVNYGAYWINIFYLLCFIPFALVIGLLLRKPCIKIMKFFNKRLEETELIV